VIISLTVVRVSVNGRFKRNLFRMVEQVRVQFEKFVDSPHSKTMPSPHLHKVPTRSDKVNPRLITSNVSRTALGPTQLPIQCVPGALFLR
jgi:hypothetical protein